MASCVKDSDDDTVLYDEAAITAFVLGTVNKYTVKDGTTTKTQFTGSKYKFVIDQLNRKVYNPDSLPYGTDAKHILCTINTINNSVALFKGIGEDDKEMYYYHSNTDSIDFSVPRQFRIVSSDATGYSDYTITVNVHQEDDVPITWNTVKKDENLAKLTALKTFYYSNYFYIFGTDDSETKIYRTKDGVSYELLNESNPLSANTWQNVTMLFNTFFMLEGNKLYASFDAVNWDYIDCQSPKPLKKILGSCMHELYALSTDNTILMSQNFGDTWEEETIDTDAKFLPTEDISIVSYPTPMADNTDYVLMVGKRSADTYPADNISMVWRKLLDYDDDSNSGFWTYMDLGGEEDFTIPYCENLNLLKYEDSVLAFYGNNKKMEDGDEPYDTFLQSRDNGITWKENSYYVMPAFETTPKWVGSAVDIDNYIWMFCAGTGEVVKGRLNRVGWDTK